MARQQIFIDARLVVETVQVAAGDKLDQVAIAFLVFAQQHQVVVAVGVAFDGVALLRDVHLAADHRMDALLLGVVVELDRAEQIAVIGHGHGGHLLLDREVHQLGDFAGSVEQRVIGVAMQMDKRRGHGRSNPGGEYQYSEVGRRRKRCDRLPRCFSCSGSSSFFLKVGRALRSGNPPGCGTALTLSGKAHGT